MGGQSGGIYLYVAQELGMMGASNEEAGQIMAIREHLVDLKSAIPWGYGETPTEKQLTAFFDEGPTDSSGPADATQRSKRGLKWFAGRLNKLVGSDGFAVGSDYSLADALIYNAFGETLKDSEANPGIPQCRREPYGSTVRTNNILDTHPNLKRIVENWRSNANIQSTWQAVASKPFRLNNFGFGIWIY